VRKNEPTAVKPLPKEGPNVARFDGSEGFALRAKTEKWDGSAMWGVDRDVNLADLEVIGEDRREAPCCEMKVIRRNQTAICQVRGGKMLPTTFRRP